MNFTLHNEIYANITDILIKAIQKLNADIEIDIKVIYHALSAPPKKDMGDIAFPCFSLAKTLKSAPPQIANELLAKLEENDLITEAKVFGPYLNFFLNPNKTNEIIIKEITTEKCFSKKLTENAPKTIVEYSQPNTHKVMHVGHMRNLCLGNAIVNLYRYAGVNTLSTTFPGDVGTHVAKCLWYYKNHNQDPIPNEEKGAWLGEMYVLGNSLLEEQKGTPQEETNRAQLTEILKQLHSGDGEYFKLWQETRQWSIDLMKEVYKWAEVSFDSWYWESDVDADSVKLVQKYYEQGLFIKDEGAIGMDLKEEKLGFCLLLKSDGTGLYATKDLELARRKFEDHKVEKSLYVVDNRQALHFKQVFKTLEKMGFENAKNCIHLQYEMVELTDGAMSSRKGNIVPIQTLITQMTNKIKDDYLKKYENEWTQEQVDETAKIVAAGAIKYGMTRVDSNKKIIFDMNEWLKLDGESGPYIQYVHARINSMLTKIGQYDAPNLSLLTHDLEHEMINKLSHFNSIICQCVEQNKTHSLCSYLYELAKAFNSFYAECSVMGAKSSDLKYARAELSFAVATTLKYGLALLGITAPLRM